MNNSWNNEHYQMQQNVIGMAPQMMQNMLQPPLMPPLCMMNDISMALPGNPPLPAVPPGPLIGPVLPETLDQGAEDMNVVDQDSDGNEEQGQKNPRVKDNRGSDRKDVRDRDRSRQPRPRSRERSDHNRGDHSDRNNIGRSDRSSRSDRNERSDRNRDRRERRSKWDGAKDAGDQSLGNGMGLGMMMQTGGMMPYTNMANMMTQQPIDMQNIQPNMVSNMMPSNHMQNMMPGNNIMSGNNMLPGNSMMLGSNMMSNLMAKYDQSMMLMNEQQKMMINQHIYISGATLLPPIHGTTIPNRRERPPGCRTIFVGGLPNGIQDDVIGEIFHRFGSISNIKLHRQGVCHVRFEKQESVEQAFFISGFRFKAHNQTDNEATTLFIDYALNRDDQTEYEKNKRNRVPTPPRVEPFSPQTLVAISEKIKSDDQFIQAGPTLAVWLERGECNKKNSGTFYSLIQASNNQIRRLFTEKMALDEEYQNLKTSLRDKFTAVITQFEQVAKILTAAKHQRVSDHFTKQQRRNIEMWLKMTEELDNLKEEFSANFDDDEIEKIGKNMVPAEKYEELKTENENLMYELEGYKNEAFLAKDEAERKFETFKAHFIAQQALQHKQGYPPLPPPPEIKLADPPLPAATVSKPQPPPPTPDDNKVFTSGPAVPPTEAKLISILTAFLMVHPLGASLDYLVSYVRSMVPNVTQATVHQVLQKYADVFSCKTSGIGASIEHRWGFVTFDIIKSEA